MRREAAEERESGEVERKSELEEILEAAMDFVREKIKGERTRKSRD